MKKEREIIIATNDTIKQIVTQEIEKYGLNADLNHIDTSQVTIMSYLFMSSKFNGDISQWDTSNVKDMSCMFAYSLFNSDISNWNVSQVERMDGMFAYSQFNQDISKWDTSNVMTTQAMFRSSLFNQDISHWNTGKVHDARRMFFDSSFNQDISKWDVRNLCAFSNMFPEHYHQKLPKFRSDNSSGLNLRLNINNFKLTIPLLNREDDKYFVHGLFKIPNNYQLSQNKKNFNLFVKFAKLYKFDLYKNFECRSSDYFHCSFLDLMYDNPYSFLICDVFHFENYSLKRKLKILKNVANNSNNSFFGKPSGVQFENGKPKIITESNLDILLIFFLKEKNIQAFYTGEVLTSFSQINFKEIFEKFEELAAFLNKTVNDFPLFKILMKKLFKLEMELIKRNDKIYLPYLKEDKNQLFSYFYPYYSNVQKDKLINLINHMNYIYDENAVNNNQPISI